MPKDISRVVIAYKDIRIGEDFNGRKVMKDIEELAESIQENGLIQPLVVREGGPDKSSEGRRTYFLVAGERRYRALGLLKRTQVEVKLVKGNSQDAALLNIVENAQRLNLEPFEEAKQLVAVMERHKLTQAQLAKKIGKSEPYISQRIALLKNTAPEVKEAVENGVITPTHAREMVTLPKDQQREVLQDIVDKKKNGKKVSVAEVKDEADKRKAALPKRRGKKAPSYDQEKVKLAKEMFEGKELSYRPRMAILEQMGALCQQAERAQSDTSKQAIKYKIAALEWVTGGRETL